MASCEYCFTPTSNARFCSLSCRNRWITKHRKRNPIYERTYPHSCDICGTPFIGLLGDKRCSEACRRDSRRKRDRDNEVSKKKKCIHANFTGVCEWCKKEHSGEYGWGRFCSPECAHSVAGTSEKLKGEKVVHCKKCRRKFQQKKRGRNATALCKDCKKPKSNYVYPCLCSLCGASFQGRNLHVKYCSDHCRKVGMKGRVGGFREGSTKNYRSGWYKGFFCQSSWELAWLIYHLDHNEAVVKPKPIPYFGEDGECHNYHPDFEIRKVLHEVKGYWQNEVEVKVKAAREQGKDIIVWRRNDLKHMISYVKETYGVKKVEDLYESRQQDQNTYGVVV